MKLINWLFRSPPRDLPMASEQEQQGPRRRYRDDVPYALPKDLEEGNRLNLQHYLFRSVLGGNFVAPLSHPSHILDIGSGTGKWGQEMAQQFPDARVFGLDLEPPQTVSASAHVQEPPVNYHFVQGNVLHGLPFPDHSFDFTHMRLLCLALPDQSWPFVLSEIKRVTRPDGWIELLELVGLLNGGPLTKHLFGLVERYLFQKGITLNKFVFFKEMLHQRGLSQAEQRFFEIPIGWNRAGELMEKDMLAGFRALQARLCETFAISQEGFEQWMNQIPKEGKQHRSSFRFVVVVARR